MTEAALPIAQRLLELFRHLGIEQAHFAARNVADWQEFATSYPSRIASLILLCPAALDMRPFTGLAARTLVITGDQGAAAERVAAALQSVEGVASVELANYEALMWLDLAAERGTEIVPAMRDFLLSGDGHPSPEPRPQPESEGEAAGIRYRIHWPGLPLVLMPLELAPSQ
jgi:pimeloyl-ACP methyl ester carboxylesterase